MDKATWISGMADENESVRPCILGRKSKRLQAWTHSTNVPSSHTPAWMIQQAQSSNQPQESQVTSGYALDDPIQLDHAEATACNVERPYIKPSDLTVPRDASRKAHDVIMTGTGCEFDQSSALPSATYAIYVNLLQQHQNQIADLSRQLATAQKYCEELKRELQRARGDCVGLY